MDIDPWRNKCMAGSRKKASSGAGWIFEQKCLGEKRNHPSEAIATNPPIWHQHLTGCALRRGRNATHLLLIEQIFPQQEIPYFLSRDAVYLGISESFTSA